MSYDEGFQKRREKFYKDFERTRKLAYVVWFVSLLFVLSFFSGMVFVVWKVLTHFGIL